MADWRVDVLKKAGIPITRSNLELMAAWARAEGTKARYNWLATTRKGYSGETQFNSVGVKNYPSYQTGTSAIADTLMLPYYTKIVGLMKQGATPAQIATAISESPWGTGKGVLNVLGAKPSSSTATAPAPEIAPDQAPSPDMQPTFDPGSLLMESSADLASGRYDPTKLSAQIIGSIQQGLIPASGGKAYPKFQNPKAVPATQDAAGIVQEAYKYLGTPYSWAGGGIGGPSKGVGRGANTVGFDCSGFLQYLMGKKGVKIPRVTSEQWKAGTAVPLKQLRPGDAVFFHGTSHVGMYIGNGKFIHAPHTGDVIKVSSMTSGYYKDNYTGGRRYG